MTGVRPYVRASCNADAGSWVAELIQWWWDPATGYPIPERSGKVRYFARAGDDSLAWYASKAAAMRATGLPREAIKSLTFIGAKLADNPALMRSDPAYLGNLMALPAVERERLLNGNWRIRPAAGLYFNRAWVRTVDIAPKLTQTARGWDLAATPATADNDPDWTTSTKVGRLLDGSYIVLDHTWLRGTPAEVERQLLNLASQDGYACTVAIPQDPGQAGKAQVAAMVRMLAGHKVDFSPETGDKVTRFAPFSAQAEAGNVLVLRGPWNERFFSMLEGVPDLPHSDDHSDATAGPSASSPRAACSIGCACSHHTPQPETEAPMSLLVLVLVIVLILGVLPTWPYSAGWGYGPSGLVAVVFVVLIVLMLTGVLSAPGRFW
jgi:predicted phage terminase large subunit-like protein